MDWMCAVCSWKNIDPYGSDCYICENCGHDAFLGSWVKVGYNFWYSTWELES